VILALAFIFIFIVAPIFVGGILSRRYFSDAVAGILMGIWLGWIGVLILRELSPNQSAAKDGGNGKG
jgi:hypothetical protein